MSINSEQVKRRGFELGFDLVGIAPAKAIAHSEVLRDWLAAGCCGQMTYLQKNVEKRIDPQLLMPGARTIICAAINYYATPKPITNATADATNIAKIARYAWRADYHVFIKRKLKALAQYITQSVGSEKPLLRCFVDSAPIVEKAHAARAGLGWIGKNGLLVNEQFGSWLLLGEIVTDLELDCDEPIEDHCQSCSRCIDACPTNALIAERTLDARLCISNLTIEDTTNNYNNTPLVALAPQMEQRIFGCDACQEACPFNQNTPVRDDPQWPVCDDYREISLDDVQKWTQDIFDKRFEKSCVSRASFEHFRSVVELCQRTQKKKSRD